MTDYSALIKELRSASTVSTAWEKLMRDAADAIEELQQIADHYEQSAKDYWKQACEYKEKLAKHLSELEEKQTIEKDVLEAAYQHGFIDGQVGAKMPKHGEWIGRSENDTAPKCSNCGKTRLGSSLEFVRKHVPYCEWCGAKMEVQE